MAKLTRCPNGHFYDGERSPRCPYCSQPDPAVPLDQDRARREPFPFGPMVVCSNGHAYDLRKSSRCPYCNGQSEAVSLR